MPLSIRRSRPSTRGYLRKTGSRYDGGTATPIPVQERMRKDGENNFLTSLKAGYRIFTVQSPTFTVAIPVDLRNALRNFPWRRNQSVSERQNRVERQMMTGAPMVTMDARSRAVRLRSATLFSPEKFDNTPSNKAPGRMLRQMLRRRKIKLNWSVGSFGLHLIPTRLDQSFRAAQATTETSNMARKVVSSLVLQLSTRIASPGRKVSASISHTAPRWVPILERENRSSYLQARLSNATIVWSLALQAAVRLSPQVDAVAFYFLKTCVISCA